MAPVNREVAFAALFAIAQATPGIQTFERRYVSLDRVTGATSPLLSQVQSSQSGVRASRLPTKWTLRADWLLYVHSDRTAPDPPIVLLNQLLDALEGALQAPLGFEKQTLGGLVEDCRIVGDIEIADAIDIPIALAIIPIEIVAFPPSV